MPLITAADQPFKALSSQMNKFLEWQKGYYGFFQNEVFTPSVNLYETEEAYIVCVDLAGVDKNKIDIEVADGRLVMKGTRHIPSCDQLEAANAASAEANAAANPDGMEATHKKVRVHLMEIDHGAFSRDVELPHDILNEKINATYRNGILWIELPKKV